MSNMLAVFVFGLRKLDLLPLLIQSHPFFLSLCLQIVIH